jgi:hypothetical protein
MKTKIKIKPKQIITTIPKNSCGKRQGCYFTRLPYCSSTSTNLSRGAFLV